MEIEREPHELPVLLKLGVKAKCTRPFLWRTASYFLFEVNTVTGLQPFIQPASRSPPGQVWDQFFYHVGSLLSRLSFLGVPF